MKIIIVDDSREFMALTRRMVAKGMPDVEITEYDPEQQGAPGRDFDWSIYDVLILDHQLGTHETGLDWLTRYRQINGFPPTILMTAAGDEYVAAKAIKLGASEFIRKEDVTTARLTELIKEVVKERRDQQPSVDHTAHPKLLKDARIFNEIRPWFDNRTPDGKPIGYRFVRLIGQGATSRVYLAERARDSTTLVLKIIDVASVRESPVVQRFVREAELISRVQSPYVVRFLEHGFTETYGYIAMEFFTRGDLKQRVEHGISIDDAVNYVIHIAHGLRAIHSVGIVHRDLKPGNIMFRSDDSLALADFGISRRLEDISELTRNGSVLGTPNYLSPEQAQGKLVDHRSDFYSTGVILYEMLTGRKPYRAENAPALVYQHVHADIPRLPETLQCFQSVIDRLLAKKPEDRINTADDLIAALRHAHRAIHAKG